MLANYITLSRFPLLLANVLILYFGSPALRLAGVALLLVGLGLDTVDGMVARKSGQTTMFGSVLDIAADRTYELVLWAVFADLGLISVVIPLVVIARTTLTDAFRSIGIAQGVAPFDQHKSKLGKFMVGSPFMRTGYSISKIVTFTLLTLAQALAGYPASDRLAGYAPTLLQGGRWLAWVALTFCVFRGLPVIIANLRRYWGMPAAAATLLLAVLPNGGLTAQQTAAPAPLPTIASKTTGWSRLPGFVTMYLDESKGTLALELPKGGLRALFVAELATGLGSNPIGLDRGANGPSYVTRFETAGNVVRVIFENWSYRTRGDSLHRRTVDEAFPSSISGALPIIGAEGDRVLVDATDFVHRDWMEVASTLQRSQEGSYAVARDRSGVNRNFTAGFPGNSEIDVSLTFATSGNPGRTVESIVPDGRAFTLRQHLTLLALPDARYVPRLYDPRVGYGATGFKDYFEPIQGDLTQRWIARHRLQRQDPANPGSPILNPIVYYIDPGIPEPVRTATFEGAKWWEEAFARAGLPGAFRVAYLPAGADPMDARYNVVQWENRNERGWSIGGAVGDPRTGELLKGMARMDSHRARTDYNLYAAFFGADAAAADTAFVLARVRQVTAHEIGHTLGLAHNYIASTYDRGSVMDYPAPRIRMTNGRPDISAAYDVGPGEYDVWAIRWGYGIWPAAVEADSLRAIVADGLRKGYRFLSDNDARPESASDPRTNLWDDAATAEEFLRHQMEVRRWGIAHFGLRNIRDGEPIATLQERFVPLYFWHRFAINSLVKTVGGMEYAYAVKGDGQQATRMISADRQRAALAQLLTTLEPSELAIPDSIQTLMAPRPGGYPESVELFATRSRPGFDALSAARTLAQFTVDGLLQRERAARLVIGAVRHSGQLTFEEVIDRLVAATWRGAATTPTEAALRRVTQRAVVDRMLTLAADRDAAQEVRDVVELKLAALGTDAKARSVVGVVTARAHWAAISADITRWRERRELPTPSPALRAPPGDPFGDDGRP
ncbi:MAG: zinc-dependent metalloprotease [Gemmatimonadales bacterium]|nr:zinc-dependent metalloprotease [Gemmatimonadales bacterium]MBP6571825.1 zinc-dependent metalloprotease [Gemmatimonadales bacterium]